jgi:hypothetical protein
MFTSVLEGPVHANFEARQFALEFDEFPSRFLSIQFFASLGLSRFGFG